MRARGFTLIELLFVMVIVTLIAAIVGPIVVGSIGNARESALREDLHVLRKAIDDYYADNGKYPAELADLVDKRYMRRIPPDPLTERGDTWVLVRAMDEKGAGGIVDVHSGSELAGSDGTRYKDW